MSTTDIEVAGSTAVATSPPSKRDMTIRERLESPEFAKAVAAVMPRHLTPDRFVRVAILAMTRTPKLAQCDKASFFNALMLLSQYGLEPDGRRAHLIPFENRKRGVTECQLIIDYKGLAELAQRSGLVSNIHADVVCENDIFEYDRGEIRRHIIHFHKPRGPVYAAYALCRFKDGSEKCDVMNLEELNRIRDRSHGYRTAKKFNNDNHPWITDWNEMAKKTVFRRLSKWLVLSPEFRDAIEKEDEFEGSVVEASENAKRMLPTSSLAEVAGMIEDETPPDDNADGASPPDSPADPTTDGAAGTGEIPPAGTSEGTSESLPVRDISTPEKALAAIVSALSEHHSPEDAFDGGKMVKVAYALKTKAEREAVYRAAVEGRIDITTGKIVEVANA